MKEQGNNKRSNHRIHFRGETLNISQWDKKLGFGRGTIYGRLKMGWSIEQSLSRKQVKPCRKNKVKRVL